MNKNELKRLIKIEDRIFQIAEEEGLEFCDIEFDIIPDQKMLEIMAYRIPGNISNWKYGRDYERLRTIHEKVRYGLPYEVVINSDPARAYLMKDNTLAIQALVMAHVVGHVAFFTMNKYFINTNKDIIPYMSAATKRFNQYERMYSIDEVERIIDAGHSIQFHSSPFDTETEDEKRKRIFEQMKKRAHAKRTAQYDDIVPIIEHKDMDISLYNQKLWKSLKEKTPVEPTEDLLRYIIDNSTYLDNWQKDILEVLRKEGQYFWPQMRTRYMNEGFACIVPNSLVHTEKGFVPIEQAIQYCNKVVGINNKLTDIKKRCVTKEIPTIKIKTNTGLELEGAEFHRLLTKVNGKKEDVHMKDLKIGDELFMSVGLNIWPDKLIDINIDSALQRQMFSKTQKVKIPHTIDMDISYLMGSLVAEGTNLSRGFTFTNQNNEYLETIKYIIENKFNKKIEIKSRKDSKTKDITLYSTPIIDFLYQAGLSNKKSHEKEIPWSILQSPKQVVSAFIGGLFDGDGCVYYDGKHSRQIIFTSKSEKLIRQITLLLLNYGIVGSFRSSKKEGYEDCYQLVISKGNCLKIFQQEIIFKDKKKNKLLEEAINSLKWSHPVQETCKIVEISHSNSINYDWYIPEGNHYVAQGFINHNTYWHEKITHKLFEEKYLSMSDHAQFNYSNSLVKASHVTAMNPYLVGSKIWEDIVMRWDKGRYGREWTDCNDRKLKEKWDKKTMKGKEKMFEIVRTHTDWFFMKGFLTTDLVEELNLYIYVERKTLLTKDLVITKQRAKKTAEMIIMSFTHSHIPKIEITDGNYNQMGYLFLKHNWSGANLERNYCEKTLQHIANIWGKNVYLETKKGPHKRLLYKVEKKRYSKSAPTPKVNLNK
jgi:stage V sporulation protein R